MKKILLLGDSIRIGYDKYVKIAFEDIAQVDYPSENCRFSSYTLRRIYDYKNELECGDDVDLIHWNTGLWDSLRLLDGKTHTPIEYYKNNIERICTILKILYPDAKMIFATSTPVQEHLFGDLKRINSDIEAYNAAAVEIVTKHGGKINDLYSLMKNCPSEYYTDSTHFYTKDGTKLITGQVISYIENALGIKAKKPDYDALFDKEKDVIGI